MKNIALVDTQSIKYYDILYNKLPEEILDKILYYYYKNTSGDINYRKYMTQLLNCELKRQFCYNCRRHFTHIKKKIINIPKIIYNMESIYNNLYNVFCILEINNIDNKLINHWYNYEIKIDYQKPLKIDENYKYVKLYYKYGEYPINYDIIKY